jgi:hypothetical protein
VLLLICEERVKQIAITWLKRVEKEKNWDNSRWGLMQQGERQK